jgi:hypothetical protein
MAAVPVGKTGRHCFLLKGRQDAALQQIQVSGRMEDHTSKLRRYAGMEPAEVQGRKTRSY